MKRLILTCDGTWNRAEQEMNGVPCPTNVVKLAYRIAKRDAAGVAQVVSYHQGVGTGNFFDRFFGGAFGEGLNDNILDGYRFLIGNYEPGDEIYVFGFSRGAFTARSLCGMLRKCGVLKRSAIDKYRQAINLYRSPVHRPGSPEATEFRKSFSVCGDDELPITFLGVWDTVGALGIPMAGLRRLTDRKYLFHDTELSGTVKNAAHALAIDEYRGAFQPTLWSWNPKEGQRVVQTWFVGAHSDVGGGYAEPHLSDIALDWMLGEASACGLALDDEVVENHPLRPEARFGPHISRRSFYRLLPSTPRRVGMAVDEKGRPTGELDPTQCLHPSVLERWDADPRWRPEGLRAYLQRRGEPAVYSR